MNIRLASQQKWSVLAFLGILGFAVAFWAYSIHQWLGPSAIYKLAAPQENYYWGAAQFEMAIARFEARLLRYGHEEDEDFEQLQDQYEILQSKLSLLATPSQVTDAAIQVPEYVRSVGKIQGVFRQIDPLIPEISRNPKVALTVAEELKGIEDPALQMAQSIGEGEVERRDLVRLDFLKKRRVFFITSAAVGVFLLVSLCALIFLLRLYQKNSQREHSMRIAEQAAVKAAKEAMRAKDAFLGAIGHELRTPLQIITAAVDNLADQPLSARNMGTVFQLEQAVEQMDAQMRDLADYSRLDAGKLRLRKEWFDLRTLLESVVKQERPMALKKGLTIGLVMDDDMPAVFSDPGRIRQVVTNLVANGIKYSDAGDVVVRCDRVVDADSGMTRVTVEDKGHGIPTDKIDSLFEPFVQLDDGNTRSYDGMGMGLTIVKGLVDLLGGEINVRSNVGHGSTFSVTLPEEKGEDEQAARGASRHRERSLNVAFRVLVVDDHATVRVALQGILDSIGVVAEACGSADDAFGKLGERQYDVLLLDIQMPGTDGVAVARKLRGSGGMNANIPIVAISAYSSDLLDSCDTDMFVEFLTKPVRAEVLKSVLRRVVR